MLVDIKDDEFKLRTKVTNIIMEKMWVNTRGNEFRFWTPTGVSVNSQLKPHKDHLAGQLTSMCLNFPHQKNSTYYMDCGYMGCSVVVVETILRCVEARI